MPPTLNPVFKKKCRRVILSSEVVFLFLNRRSDESVFRQRLIHIE